MLNSGTFIVCLTALLVSLSSIFSAYAYEAGANPQTMIFFRFLMFCSLFIFIKNKTRSSARLTARQTWSAILAGGFFTLGSGSLLASIFFLPVSLAVVIFYLYPILTLLGGKILDRQPMSPLQTGCFILAFFGIILALNLRFDQHINPGGLIFGITAALSMAISYLISDRTLKSVPAEQSTGYLAATGLVLISAYILVTGSFHAGHASGSNYLYIALASMSFAAAFFLMFKGINLIGAVRTSMLLNLEPVMTILLAFIMLNERLNVVQIAGVVCVLLAILVIQKQTNRI